MTSYQTAEDPEDNDIEKPSQSSNVQTESQDTSSKPLLNYEIEEKAREDARKKWMTIGGISFAIILLIIIIVIAVDESKSKNKKKNYVSILIGTPSISNIHGYLLQFLAKPHVAGTPQQAETSNLMQGYLEDYGWLEESNIGNGGTDAFPVTLSEYLHSSITMLNKSNLIDVLWTADLRERIYREDEDPYSNTTYNGQAWLGYIPAGSVIGDVIYVNYARKEDFELLLSNSYNLDGKIGIARYGNMFRGAKVMLAEEYGLSGLMIYSDPEDDGYVKGPVFPQGPWRPATSFQRGSTQYSFLCPGDPTTNRTMVMCNGQTYDDVTPGIPAIPMSWSDAIVILKNLSGQAIRTGEFAEWAGGLNMTYHIGGRNTTYVNLTANNTKIRRELYNVIGFVAADKDDGYQNETVIIGNHRDAWVYGAGDPTSGTAVMLEIARSFQNVIKQGWKPKRNIMIGSWDGEEFALIGSTHFTEMAKYQKYLDTTVAYLNIDPGVTGPYLSVDANPLLNNVILDSMKLIPSPGFGATLFDYFKGSDGRIGVLGMGSDYVAFQHRLGIPSVNSIFTGTNGCYHSVYDDYTWLNLVDPDLTFHKTLAQFMSLLAFNIVDSDILPYNLTTLNDWLLNEINTTTNYMAAVRYSCTVNPDYYNLVLTAISVQKSGITQLINKQNKDFPKGDEEEDSNEFYKKVSQYNVIYKNLFRMLMDPKGMPGKQDYYKNIIFGPDPENGYASLNFPLISYYIRNGCNDNEILDAYNRTATFITKTGCYLGHFAGVSINGC